jgi:hypothetical protein
MKHYSIISSKEVPLSEKISDIVGPLWLGGIQKKLHSKRYELFVDYTTQYEASALETPRSFGGEPLSPS